MRTFIFVENIRNKDKGNWLERVIVGMTQSDMYPSTMVNSKDSEFYACQCVEVSEHCHIRLGVLAD